MPDYEAIYHKVFNLLTDIHNMIEEVQQEAEELYVKPEEDTICE